MSLSAGLIAGISIGSVLGLALVAACILLPILRSIRVHKELQMQITGLASTQGPQQMSPTAENRIIDITLRISRTFARLLLRSVLWPIHIPIVVLRLWDKSLVVGGIGNTLEITRTEVPRTFKVYLRDIDSMNDVELEARGML